MVVEYKKSSPYFNTLQKNFFIQYLDFYTVRPIPANSNDDLVIIDQKYHQRPDLFSNELYGTPDLWWIFSVRNPDLFIDPIYDFISGTELFVPTRLRMLNTLLGT